MQPSFACGVILHEIVFGAHPVGTYPLGKGATAMMRTAEKYLRSVKRSTMEVATNAGTACIEEVNNTQEGDDYSLGISPTAHDAAAMAIIGSGGQVQRDNSNRHQSGGGGGDKESNGVGVPQRPKKASLLQMGLSLGTSLLRALGKHDRSQAQGYLGTDIRSPGAIDTSHPLQVRQANTRYAGLFSEPGEVDYASDTEWRQHVGVLSASVRPNMGWELLGPRVLNNLRNVILQMIDPVPRSRMPLGAALSNLEDALAWCADEVPDGD